MRQANERVKRSYFFAALCVLGLAALVTMPLGCGGGSSGSSGGGPTIPQVTSTIPADGATAVSTTVLAVINFSEPMDTPSVMDNIFMSGVAGTTVNTWTNGDATLNVDFSSAPLDTNTTYTVNILSNAKDKEGDKLAASVNFAFSTGASLATGSISGTISDDPQSDYDNSLENTIVAVTGNDFLGTGDSTPIVIVQADSGGNFTANNLKDGTYYIIAVQETTGDTVDPSDGDSIGVYRDILAYASSAVTVTGGSGLTNIDFTLHDPEAIAGELTYAGADTGDMSSVIPDLYAYIGTIFFTGDTRLTTEVASSSDYFSYIGTSSPLWSYSLNPFVDSGISTSGVPDSTLTGTGLDYIPPGSYHVLAAISTNVGNNAALGFAPNLAVIADTGADAPGTDIVMYDTDTIVGDVEVSRIGRWIARYPTSMASSPITTPRPGFPWLSTRSRTRRTRPVSTPPTPPTTSGAFPISHPRVRCTSTCLAETWSHSFPACAA